MIPEQGVLTTAQAADYLGVKVQTLYAYVSRGVLAPARREPGVGSLFAVEDVRALAGRPGRSGRRSGPASGVAISEDVRTAITEIGPGSLAYRGHDVRDLAGAWIFEQVRDLLTGVPLADGRSGGGAPHSLGAAPRDPGDSASAGMPSPASVRSVTDAPSSGVLSPAPVRSVTDAPSSGMPLDASVGSVMAALPATTRVLDRAKHAVLVAGDTDLGRHDPSPEAFAAAGARAASAMVTAVGSRTALASADVPDAGASGGESVSPALAAYLELPADLAELALVLLADHDLAVSTTAVRVAVSAGADGYSALLAGLAAADSPRHVGASARALDWLRGAVQDPRGALAAALTDGPPPGFGHVVYTEADPRAQLLLDRLLPDADAALRAAVALLEEELVERRGWVLNVDLALAAMMLVHDLPRDAGAAIFACARTAGWTAHAIEELAEPGMRFRLRGVYTGARQPQPVSPSSA